MSREDYICPICGRDVTTEVPICFGPHKEWQVTIDHLSAMRIILRTTEKQHRHFRKA